MGAAGAGFLHALEGVTELFHAHPWCLWLLPPFGLGMVWLYQDPLQSCADGRPLLLRQIHTPAQPLPLVMGPAIIGTTLLSHLGGASVGREGTALQMGGALADQFGRLFTLNPRERQTLLRCGVSAGFSAVFGTPMAAAVFALEFSRPHSWRIIPCMITALLADAIAKHLFGAKHTDFTVFFPTSMGFSGSTLLQVALVGVACGLAARIYLTLSRWQTDTLKRTTNPYVRVIIGGLLFISLIQIFGPAFTGLGLPSITAAFTQAPASPITWLIKLIATLICVNYGFRGGEVTPLFFIGATLGSTLAHFTGAPLALGAGLGLVAVFAGVGAVPLAGSVMALELFRPTVGAYALLACLLSWLVAGQGSLDHESKA